LEPHPGVGAGLTHLPEAPTDTLSLLVVDDDPLKADLLRRSLERTPGVTVEQAGSALEAATILTHRLFDAVLTDLVMPGMDGIDLVRRIRATDPGLPILILTGNATVERAVEGIRAGATDFLQYPVNPQALLSLIQRAVAERPVREEIADRRTTAARATGPDYLTGSHPRLEAIRAFSEQIAGVPFALLLITGESGTGKTHVARAIHERSGARGRFVQVNCAALTPQLLESELFGHERGAFTDARQLKRGLAEVAQNGTLLLDEIGAMPLDLQSKLLVFLDTQEIRRVGGVQSIPVRTRVIAATNEDLEARIAERTFREDVYYRLAVATIEMPSLRDLPTVIPELAAAFVRQVCASNQRAVPPLTAHSFEALQDYPWPGNARELRNAVERALIFHSAGPLVVQPPQLKARRDATLPLEGLVISRGLTLEEVDRRYMQDALEANQQQMTLTARQLGISRKSLWERRRRYGL
jgi:DNA-binding NtrC family response regulator